MMRHLAAVAVALCFNVAPLLAQELQFTVKSTAAEIHKYPSIGSPIIGKAPRGAVLPITREIGHWMRVQWPDGEDGVGYVHLAGGTVTRNPDGPSLANAVTPGPSAPSPVSAQESSTQSLPTRSTPPLRYVDLPTHVVGIGAGMNANNGAMKATVRGWSPHGLGFQFEMSHATYFQFSPSLLYSLPDAVGNYVWVRPYVGGGPSILRSTPSTQLEFQAFGGGEFTLANVPQFAVSADLAYRRPRTPIAGADKYTLNVSLSAHWYIR